MPYIYVLYLFCFFSKMSFYNYFRPLPGLLVVFAPVSLNISFEIFSIYKMHSAEFPLAAGLVANALCSVFSCSLPLVPLSEKPLQLGGDNWADRSEPLGLH